jgi:hypothetical protein
LTSSNMRSSIGNVAGCKIANNSATKMANTRSGVQSFWPTLDRSSSLSGVDTGPTLSRSQIRMSALVLTFDRGPLFPPEQGKKILPRSARTQSKVHMN